MVFADNAYTISGDTLCFIITERVIVMRELTTSEEMIMKVIWDQEKDVPILTLMEALEEAYHKEYKRTTIQTFLLKLSDKRYASTYRNGKAAYVHADVTKDEYQKHIAKRDVNKWFGGNLSGFVASFTEQESLTEEEENVLRGIVARMKNAEEKEQ